MNIERIESGPAYAGASFDELRITQSEIYEREQSAMRSNFAHACQKADANALCDWAPRRTDFSRFPEPRTQTLAEVMADSLDFDAGPGISEVMQLVLNVAHGSNLAQAPQQARELLKRMGAMYAHATAGSEE
jgi:hypothetical protein